MTEEPTGASTRTSRLIKARPEELYGAFIDPAALVAWLPPGEMTGKIHEFDARVGGGYRMSLFYPPNERAFRGKTSDREDRFNVRFVELAPPRRIVEAVHFDTTDPAFFGEMTLVVTFEEVVRRNRSHDLVREPTARPAGGGQRGRLAIVTGTAGSPLRMTGRRLCVRVPCAAGGERSRVAPQLIRPRIPDERTATDGARVDCAYLLATLLVLALLLFALPEPVAWSKGWWLLVVFFGGTTAAALWLWRVNP